MKNIHSINLKQYLARTGRLGIPLALALLLAVALPGLIWAATFITTVDTGTASALNDAGQAGSVALKSNGLAVISYWDKTAGNVGDLKVAFCNDLACSNPTIQSIDDMENARTTSVALTGSDVPVISYPGLNGMQVAFCNSATDCSSPITRTIDSGVTALYSSLALNSSGFPVVSYSEGLVVTGQTFARLKVAFCQDAACNSVTTRVVDGDGTTTTTGEYNSLALTGGDVPVISYAEQSGTIGGRLMLATCESATDCSSPTINIVDNSNPVNALPSLLGRYSSLALNSSGFPVISYYEERGFDLKLAVCSDALCSSSVFSTTVDTAGDVGQYSSLALTLNSSGFPVISYVDVTNTALKLATCNDATCSSPTLQTLDNTGAVGQYASLALNSTDGPAVSYYDVSNKDLKLYYNTTACNTNSWTANNEASLNSAIACFNGKTTAGTYTITVTQNIDLTASTSAINNSTSGASLTIVGNDYEVWGQDIVGVRPFEISANTTVTMTNLTVSGGNITGFAGGGGIFNEGNLTIVNSTITGNTNEDPGGGIANIGTLLIENSTISDNTATNSTGAGGGIYAENGNVTVRNSTVSGNTSPDSGAAIYNVAGTVLIESTTIANNSSGYYGTIANQGTTISNSILADNGTEDCATSPAGQKVTDGGHNLIGTQSGCGFTNGVNGNIVGQNPVLGPLDANGGDTETHALLNNSPAIDAGSTSLTTDQRGIARPSGAGDDIGAYESFCGTATSWAAGSELELDAAIGCFNQQTVAQSYTITVTGDFTATDGSPTIDNPNSGLSLVIEGGNHTLDGNGRQGFTIQSATDVTMNNLTLTDWRNLLGGGAIRHNNVDSHLMLNNMTLTHNTSGFGAGALYSQGVVTVTNSTFYSNTNNSVGGGGAIVILGPGKLTLIDSELTDNAAADNGGAILAQSNSTIIIENSTIGGNTAGVEGGGIFNEGHLTIDQSTVSGNTASDTGGGVANGGTSTGFIRNSTISGNSATGSGGGLVAGGKLTLDSTTVANNTAGSIGGGVFLKGPSVVTLTNSLLGDNTSTGLPGTADCGRFGGTTLAGSYNLLEVESCDFGELTNTVNGDPVLGPLADNGGQTFTHALLGGSPAIDAGSTSLTNDQRGYFRPENAVDDIGAVESCGSGPWTAGSEAELNGAITCFNSQTSGSHTITVTQDIDLTASTIAISNSQATLKLVGNRYTLDGQGIAGVRPVTVYTGTLVLLDFLTIQGGNSDIGGGLLNYGFLTMGPGVTLRDNAATLGGGGLANYGSLSIGASTISDNSATGALGGGIFNADTSSLILTNSTLSGNNADLGGGIYNTGALDLRSVTIAANTVTDSDGGGALFADGVVTMTNSILAGSTGSEDCYFTGLGSFVSGQNNLIETQTTGGCGVVGDIVNTDPKLGPLDDNGGDTETHALLAGSPAINVGSTILSADQRGIDRPTGAGDDIGAYESFCGTATSWAADSELELDAAINCFNQQTVAQSYTITVTANISMTGSIAGIDNPTVGPSLVIEGGNHTLDGDGRQGFGIRSATAVTMNDLTLTDWRNLLGGGAIRHDNVDSHLMLNNMTLTHNTSGFGAGALFSRGVVTVTNSTFYSNTNNSVRGGGAIDINGPGKLTLIDSELTDNAAAGNGGAILAENNPTIIIERSLIDGNSADGDGGGIYQPGGTTTISDSTIANNTAKHGGGIDNLGNLTLTNTDIAGNTATNGGAGLHNEGVLTATAVTVRNNTAGSGGSTGTGGGLQNDDQGVSTFINSTFSGNQATGTSDDGGGAIMVYGGEVHLRNATLTLNRSATNGGGIAIVNGIVIQDAKPSAVTLDNTIVAGNSANGSGPDLSGVISSRDYNLIGDVAGATFATKPRDITGQPALLGPLGDHGGATFTHVPQSGSPAIDKGNSSLTSDQRGATRPLGVATDIGAVEANSGDGTIIIRKTTAPAGGVDAEFSISGLGTFTLKDGGKQVYHNVAAGVYTVTETSEPTGFNLSGVTCSDSLTSGTASSGNVLSYTATINLDPGETVSCRFVNAQDNYFTVEQITIPGSTDSFSFNGSGVLGAFSVTAGQVELNSLSNGTYTLTQTAQSGYKLTSLSCTDSLGNSATGNLTSGSVSLTTATAPWHCAFINTKANFYYFPIIFKNGTP